MNAKKEAVRLEAEVGELLGDLRVIELVQGPADTKRRGLGRDERVIVRGLQRVRPGMVVVPKPAA